MNLIEIMCAIAWVWDHARCSLPYLWRGKQRHVDIIIKAIIDGDVDSMLLCWGSVKNGNIRNHEFARLLMEPAGHFIDGFDENAIHDLLSWELAIDTTLPYWVKKIFDTVAAKVGDMESQPTEREQFLKVVLPIKQNEPVGKYCALFFIAAVRLVASRLFDTKTHAGQLPSFEFPVHYWLEHNSKVEFGVRAIIDYMYNSHKVACKASIRPIVQQTLPKIINDNGNHDP